MDFGSLGGLGGGGSSGSKEFGRSSAEVSAVGGNVNSGTNVAEWLPVIVLAGLGLLVVLALLRK